MYAHTIMQAARGNSCGAHLFAYVAVLLTQCQLPVLTNDSFASRINFVGTSWERDTRTLMTHLLLG